MQVTFSGVYILPCFPAKSLAQDWRHAPTGGCSRARGNARASSTGNNPKEKLVDRQTQVEEHTVHLHQAAALPSWGLLQHLLFLTVQ